MTKTTPAVRQTRFTAFSSGDKAFSNRTGFSRSDALACQRKCDATRQQREPGYAFQPEIQRGRRGPGFWEPSPECFVWEVVAVGPPEDAQEESQAGTLPHLRSGLLNKSSSLPVVIPQRDSIAQ